MNEDQRILTDDEIDTIGEVLNISMGAAATAVSTMLERQVVITTPSISQNQLQNVDFSALEPAVVVKIKYIEGLTGTNVIVIRRKDMGVILDLLMGNDFNPTDEYEFDEMSMSAACEVMNQMMGSSATAMSEMLNKTINISTPQAILVEHSDDPRKIFDDIRMDQNVVSVSFKMSIKETLDTTFSCVMPLGLSRDIVYSVNGGICDTPELPQTQMTSQPPYQALPEIPPMYQAPQEMPVQPMYQAPQETQMPPMQQAYQAPPVPPMQQQMPTMQAMPQTQQMPQTPNYWQQGMPNDPQLQPPGARQPNPYQQPYDPSYQYMQYQQPYPQQPYGQPNGQPNGRPYPYGPSGQYPEQQNPRYVMPSLNVKQAEFPDFSAKNGPAAAGFGSNLNMLMGVQLEVSVVIGRTKQKIKDVLDLGQGSVIELDKQTGSPAEIMVNGQLLAYGDVVVVGDNFGIRITDIVGTKELIDSLEKNNK